MIINLITTQIISLFLCSLSVYNTGEKLIKIVKNILKRRNHCNDSEVILKYILFILSLFNLLNSGDMLLIFKLVEFKFLRFTNLLFNTILTLFILLFFKHLKISVISDKSLKQDRNKNIFFLLGYVFKIITVITYFNLTFITQIKSDTIGIQQIFEPFAYFYEFLFNFLIIICEIKMVKNPIKYFNSFIADNKIDYIINKNNHNNDKQKNFKIENNYKKNRIKFINLSIKILHFLCIALSLTNLLFFLEIESPKDNQNNIMSKKAMIYNICIVYLRFFFITIGSFCLTYISRKIRKKRKRETLRFLEKKVKKKR